MTANINPIFTLTPRIEVVQATTANTARDGSGTIVTGITGTVNGTKINRIITTATGTVTAGVVRIFIDNGTNVRLFKELMVTATTPSTTIETFRVEYIPIDLVLPEGYILKYSTHNTETFNIFQEAGDF